MRNKFNARKVIDPNTGELFDSQKEYQQWRVLRILEQAGKITDLQRQVKFELIPSQREESTEVYKAGPQKGLPRPGAVIEKPCTYIADFVYKVPVTTQYENEDGHLTFADGYVTVVEDVKGYKKGAAYELFSLKRKLMLFIHGIRVREI